ncbi:hypothetical protein R8Z50_09675 [Longispora sp. K20-0274]|uniref:hypothetical protein n=1 Tax=Longispora sp. K20-0274 TaxID=3088255 RepID=UPI00399995D2
MATKRLARRLAATAVLGAVLAGTLVATAGPAQAYPPGDPIGYYATKADCQAAGDAGQEETYWSSYWCLRSNYQPYTWNLYVTWTG